MTDLHNNDNNYNASDYWKDLIANLDGSFEEYKLLRKIIMKDGVDGMEKWFQKESRSKNMSEYIYNFEEVREHIDYLHDLALELEDYEFCQALVNPRLYAYWKSTAIDEQLSINYDDLQSDQDWFDNLSNS